MSKDQVNKTDMEPDSSVRAGRATEEPEQDAEGHGHRYGAATDDPSMEPEGVIKATDDDEPAERQPTDPDSGHYSDRNLKVAVVPVAW